ncbi:MAG: FHA domain-containing protein [Azoarcus sp.]|jgi:hypothetical protein|nr:FHA domain-containing protein [Azoarcus sp.]
MTNSRNQCVLIAEIVGGDKISTRLGEAETNRAVERCLNRVDLAIGGSGGEIVARDHAAVIATFAECDGGVMAACEAIDRVRKLPPVSGTQMQLRIGVHCGAVIDGHGEGVEGARRIVQVCAPDQSLASTAAVAGLSPAVRNFASAEAFHDDFQGRLPWPVFTIGSQTASAVAHSASMRPPPQPASPLTGSRVVAAAVSAREPSLNPRLRVKHGQDTFIVEENRPIVLLGRELGNDVVIVDARASRQHARIERRREGYVLVDQSTNGCYLAVEGQDEICIKGKEAVLDGSGRIGCGFSVRDKTEDDTVFFEFV